MDPPDRVAAHAKVQIPFQCKGNLPEDIASPYLECLMLDHLKNR